MLKKFALLLGFSLLLAVAIARIAVWLQTAGFSTVILFPLTVGAVLGTIVGFVAAGAGITCRKQVAAAAALAGLACAFAEHGFFYLDYCQRFETKLESDPKAQLAATMNPEQFKPASFSQYISTEAAENWPLWIIDAVAMIGAAATAAWFVFGNFDALRRSTAATKNSVP